MDCLVYPEKKKVMRDPKDPSLLNRIHNPSDLKKLSIEQLDTLAAEIRTRIIQTVGEATGAMDAMLSKIADFYDEEVEVAVEALTSLMEPVMMVFLGTIIGGIVVAMYLPVFKLAGSIGGG